MTEPVRGNCGESCECKTIYGVPLLDVSGIPVKDLLDSDNPALARSVQRLLDNLADPNGVISAFGSYV